MPDGGAQVSRGSRTSSSAQVTVAEMSAAPSMWKPTSTTGRSVKYWTKPISALRQLDDQQHHDRAACGRAARPVAITAKSRPRVRPTKQEHQVGVQLAHLQRVEPVARRVLVAGVRARSR